LGQLDRILKRTSISNGLNRAWASCFHPQCERSVRKQREIGTGKEKGSPLATRYRSPPKPFCQRHPVNQGIVSRTRFRETSLNSAMLVHVEEKGVDVVFYDNIPSKDLDASL